MKAAVVNELGTPMRIEDRPIPAPGPGEVVVHLEAASGLCHTDIQAANGDWPIEPAPPFVPGHEGVGRITDVGDGEQPNCAANMGSGWSPERAR